MLDGADRRYWYTQELVVERDLTGGAVVDFSEVYDHCLIVIRSTNATTVVFPHLKLKN